MKNPVQHPYFRHIWYMVHRYKYGWLQIITGQPGSGKSWTALTQAEIIDPNFSIDNVGFTPKEYLDVIDGAKSGSFVVWDECGVAVSSRKWQSTSNILITEVLQTMRHRRLGVILVVPDMSFIDVQARKLIHCYMEAKRYAYNPPQLWVYEINIDRKTGKIYFPHPKIRYKGMNVKLRNFILKRKPSEDLVKEYEKRHKSYKLRIERKARQSVGVLERELGDSRTVFDYMKYVVSNQEKFTSDKGKIDWRLIKPILKLSREKSQQIQMLARKELMDKS